MRRNGDEDAFSAGEAVEVGGIDVMRGFLEISGELLRRLRFSGACLCFFVFLSRCLGGGVESIVGFGFGGFFLATRTREKKRLSKFPGGGRVTLCTHVRSHTAVSIIPMATLLDWIKHHPQL